MDMTIIDHSTEARRKIILTLDTPEEFAALAALAVRGQEQAKPEVQAVADKLVEASMGGLTRELHALIAPHFNDFL